MVLNGFDNITERFLKCPTVYVRLWVWRLPLKLKRSWPGTRFSFLDSGPENPWKYQPSALRSPNWKGFSRRHCPARWWSISCSPSACTAHAAQHTIWPKITMLQNPALLDLHNSNGTLVIDQWCIFGSLGRKCKRYCNVWSAPGTTKTTEATLSHMMQYASDCCVELEYVHGLHHWGVAGSRFQEDLPWRCPQKCLPVANSHVSSYCTTPSCVVVTLKWMAQLRFGMFFAETSPSPACYNVDETKYSEEHLGCIFGPGIFFWICFAQKNTKARVHICEYVEPKSTTSKSLNSCVTV